MSAQKQQNWTVNPPRYTRSDPSKIKWRKGRPVVPGVENNDVRAAKWTNLGVNGYTFENLANIYPWAKVFRGGVIPICNRKILMVKEKDRIVIGDEEVAISPGEPMFEVSNNVIRGFYGFAKGAVDKSVDRTILDTAIREYEEEMGVRISPEDVWFPTLIYERPEVGEVLIFFPIIYNKPPQFNVNMDELDGYQWFSLNQLRNMKKQMSSPTRAVVHHLGSFRELGT